MQQAASALRYAHCDLAVDAIERETRAGNA